MLAEDRGNQGCQVSGGGQSEPLDEPQVCDDVTDHPHNPWSQCTCDENFEFRDRSR